MPFAPDDEELLALPGRIMLAPVYHCGSVVAGAR